MKIHRMQEKFIKKIPEDLNICLLGLEGSRGLGLPIREDSDYDYRGIFIANTEDLLSLNPPRDTIEIADDEVDFVLHEIGKFFKLALKGNPSIISLLFFPKYNIKSDIGDMIVKNRDLFLNGKHIRNAFGGYAMSQILYLKRNHKMTKGRTTEEKISKHIKHCFRLFDQGQELLETGKITIPIIDPQKYVDIATNISREEAFALFEERDKEFRNCKSVLSEESDEYMVNKLLIKVRRQFL